MYPVAALWVPSVAGAVQVTVELGGRAVRRRSRPPEIAGTFGANVPADAVVSVLVAELRVAPVTLIPDPRVDRRAGRQAGQGVRTGDT